MRHELMAKLIFEKLPPVVFAEDLDGARKLISHFQDIAEGWLANTTDDSRC
jgi:hypothetical protein